MEALPAILESVRVSLVVTAALVAFGVCAMTLMLYRQSRILRDLAKRVTDTEALLRDTHA